MSIDRKAGDVPEVPRKKPRIHRTVSEMEMDKQQPPAYGPGVYPNQPYPNQPYPNQPYPQQPYPGQPGTTVVTGVPTQTVIVQQGPVTPQSYMILSCFVFWCCNCIFGGIAFIFSVMSNSAADNNDMEQARRLGRISMWVNVAGIIVTVVLIIIVIILNSVVWSRVRNCYYPYC